MHIKTEHVKAKDIRLGDAIIHWGRTLEVDIIEPNERGFIFTASEPGSGDYARFVRRPDETLVRLTIDEAIK